MACFSSLLLACGGEAFSSDEWADHAFTNSDPKTAPDLAEVGPSLDTDGAPSPRERALDSNEPSASGVSEDATSSERSRTPDRIATPPGFVRSQGSTDGHGPTLAIVVAGTPEVKGIVQGTTWNNDRDRLRLTGAGFVPSSVVRLDGVDLPTTFVSPHALEARLPELTATQRRTIEVHTPPPGGGTSTVSCIPVYATTG